MRALGEVSAVTAFEGDPVRAWMTRVNAGCAVVEGDVTMLDESVLDPGLPYHCDPSRRDAGRGRRSSRLDDLSPGRAFLERLVARDGVIKLGPGSDLEDVPAGELELVSEGGAVRQLLVWTGSMASTPAGTSRRATLADSGATVAGSAGETPIAEALGSFVYTFDASLERLGLQWIVADSHGLLAAGSPRSGLLTGGGPIESPWLRGFEVAAEMPWSVKTVRKWLASHDGGVVEVKTRGGVIDADSVAKQLRGKGSNDWTVFVQRLGGPVRAIVTRRTA